MQREMIKEIEESHPKMIVYTDNQLSWGWEPGLNSSDPRMYIFNWMRDYLDARYDLIAEVPIDKAGGFMWGFPCQYYIFQRK